MPNCVHCGVAMAAAERTVTKNGVTVAAIHVDCTHREEMTRLAAFWDKSVLTAIQSETTRYAARRNGTPTQWP